MAVKDDDRPERDSDAPDSGALAEPEASEPQQEAEGDTAGEAASLPPAEPAAEPSGGRPAPLWVVPLYLVGLCLVYLGERVLEPMPSGHWIATLTGLGMVAAATLVRASPKFRVGGERRDIEQLLFVLSLLGCVALALYFATTDFGWEKLGLIKLEPETQERVRGVLTITWVAFVAVAALPMLFAEAALLPMRHAERPEARRVRAAAVSAITLVIAAVYGALFVYSASKIDWKADYSYFKTSQPSDSTRKIAESLTEPLTVVAFFPEVNEIKNEVKGYLEELRKGVPNLKVEVTDRLLEPKRAKELKVTQDGVIVLAKGEGTKTGAVSESLLIGIDDKNARPKLKTLDRDFQEKLLKIVRSRRLAYLTVGHGELNDSREHEDPERAVRIARTLLQKQNYLIKDLGLAQGLGSDVPDDADVVLILGPTEPFSSEELSALRRYADRGGRLLIALDPDAMQWGEAAPAGAGEEPEEREEAPATTASAEPSARPDAGRAIHDGGAQKPKRDGGAPKPALAKGDAGVAKGDAGASAPPPPPAPAPNGLDALARVVGVEFSTVELANERQHMRRRFNDSDRTLLFSNRFSSHASVSTLSRNSARAAVLFFGAGSLERATGSNEKIDFSVHSMSGTFADSNKNYKADPDEKLSTFNLAASVTKPRTGEPLKRALDSEKKDDKKGDKKDDKKKADSDEMRAFVLADADALTDVIMAQVPGNQVLFADSIRWLGGEESFSGEVNNEEDIRIEHTKQKDLAWFYATIFGAPALVLGLGLFYGRRSRQKGGRS
jgi:ABC-type uncharacterized transport system